MRLLITIIFVLITFNSSANEQSARRDIGSEVRRLYANKQYADVIRLADHYRESGERTSSGLWKLTLFYGGIIRMLDTSRQDEAYWAHFEEKARGLTEFDQNNPLGHILYAETLIQKAWSYRGHGYAHEVKKENWESFHGHLNQASNYLKQWHNVASKDPHWYVQMIRIATYQGWESEPFFALMNEAVKRHPAYYEIYFKGLSYLSPRWHGSKDSIEKFARKTAEITQPVEGNAMYARIYWVASQIHYGEELFLDSSVDWDYMRLSIDDVLARYPDQWNINHFAYFSCLAADRDKSKELMLRISGPPIATAWQNLDNYERCREWALNQGTLYGFQHYVKVVQKSLSSLLDQIRNLIVFVWELIFS